MQCILNASLGLSAIDVGNIILFAAGFLFAISNCVLAYSSHTQVSKLIMLHSLLIMVISGVYIGLQVEWLLADRNDNLPGITIAAWAMFESLVGMALVFYSLAMGTLLRWKHTLHSIDENFIASKKRSLEDC